MGLFSSDSMNEELSGKQRGYFILYLAFMGVSVWATGDSIARTTHMFPVYCYAFGFIVLSAASFCLNLIKKSRGNEYVPNRSFLLIFGILGFLFFWLISLTSNTHNFYYLMTIEKLQQKELNDVKNQLELIKKKGIASFEAGKANFETKVGNKVHQMKEEILNKGNVGHGSATDSIILDIEKMLGVNIQRLDVPGGTGGLSIYANEMARNIREATRKRLGVIDEKIKQLDQFIKNEKFDGELNILEKSRTNYPKEKTEDVRMVLRNAYAFYDKCYQFVQTLFKDRFLRANTQLSVVKLPSVPKSLVYENIDETWKDFLTGNFDRSRFFLALIWAISVDFACFLLFYFGVLPPNE